MIRAVGFLDVSFFTATLINRYREKVNPLLPLRARDAEGVAADLAILKEWKSGKALLVKLRSQLASFNNGRPVKLGDVAVEQLDPGKVTAWERAEDEYSVGVYRLRICLVPSPGDWLYCAGASLIPPVGQVLNFDHRAWHSCANFGMNRRLHLIVDVLKPEAPDEAEAIGAAALASLDT